MPDADRYLDPPGLALVARMELVARQAVEGFLSGLHPSPYFGSSVEYADHRPYTLGDDPRSIDWKLLAKTDKPYVKLFAEQTNCRCTVVLDVSKSMAFTDGERQSKLEYGSYLTAALAYLLLRQNDAAGLALVDNGIRRHIPARSTATHFRAITQTLAETEPNNDTGLGDVLHELAGRIGPRGIVVVVSDLIDDPDKITHGLGHLRHKRHDVIVMHVMDPDELSFPYERLTRFRDMEGAGSLIANPRRLRAQYMDRMNDWLDRLRRGCHERHVSYELARTDTPYAQLLSAFLERRSATKAG